MKIFVVAGAIVLASVGQGAAKSTFEPDIEHKELPMDRELEMQLQQLAGLLGERQHLQDVCVSPRDRRFQILMTKLLALEAPPGSLLYESLAASFTEGLRAGQDQFPICSPQAGDRIAAVQNQAARLADALYVRYAQ